MLISVKKWTTLLALVVLQISGLFLFARGFFPSKVVLPGAGTYHDAKAVPPAQYDKLILMVVDLMRSDFMFSEDSNMHFVHSLINQGKALGFTAFSNPPTVTLPRLKGITTGSTPNFLDAILNIAEDDTSSTLGDQDSWIKQLYANDKTIHMFGDDTWIKLFPNYFTKYEGTSSFYVADFTEVDNNVTRHLDSELNDPSWDCLILHYLGLDHIGHKGGPLSSNMPAKQEEMDHIIERIYNEHVKHNDNTLFVVLGDHGMNEVGNHGGSSAGETSAALLAISNRLQKFTKNNLSQLLLPLPVDEEFTYYQRIQQIDLVPTLATLLGFPIPKNNLGIFIDDFKHLYHTKTYKTILLENAYQLKQLVEHSFGAAFTPSQSNKSSFEKFSNLWYNLEKTQNEDTIKEFISLAQSKLAESSTNYNYEDIYLGIGIFGLTTVVFVIWALQLSYASGNLVVALPLLVFSVLLSLSSFGSSLIEEEYQVWWWFTTIFVTFLIAYLRPSRPVFTFLAITLSLRIIRGWNNSGQKFNLQSNFKIGKYLNESDWNVNFILAFYFVFLFVVFQNSGFFKIFEDYQLFIFLPIFTLVSLSLMAKLITCYLEDELVNAVKFNKLVLEVIQLPKDLLQLEELKKCLNPIFIAFYYTLLGLVLLRIGVGFQPKNLLLHRLTFFTDLSYLITLFLINQSPARNLIVYGVFLFLRDTMGKMFTETLISKNKEKINIFKICLVHTSFLVLIQNFSFFSMGNTNSLSTVDLTNAFNGLADYDLVLCGILTFTSNWAAPIFWSISYLALLLENGHLVPYKFTIIWSKLLILMTYYSIIGLGLMVACLSLRFHLFIWTVFSPKILFYGSWYLFMNIGIDFLVSLVLVLLY